MWKDTEAKKTRKLTHVEIKRMLIEFLVMNDTIETENFYGQEYEIFRIVFLYKQKHIARFSSLQKLIFSVRLVFVITTRIQYPWLHFLRII